VSLLFEICGISG